MKRLNTAEYDWRDGEACSAGNGELSAEHSSVADLEFAMVIANHAFERWIVRCMAAAGVKDMTSIDVLIILHVNQRNTEKSLSDICFVLNIEDTHIVSYGLKKLLGMKLVANTKRGKEVFFSITRDGRQLCERYEIIRNRFLLGGLDQAWVDKFNELATVLTSFSAGYDQAARSASSF